MFRKKLCLEIGTGHSLQPYADVLMDRYLEDNSQRGGPLKIDKRPFIIGDIHDLPFKNNSFDYIICRHVLEHLKNPEKAIKEMMRVGKAGYIECPSEISEILEPHRTYHRWFVNKIRNAIIFSPKSKEKVGNFKKLLYSLWKDNFSFKLFYRANNDIFLVKYEWEKNIKWKIKKKKDEIDFEKEETYLKLTKENLFQLLHKIISKFITKLIKKIVIDQISLILRNKVDINEIITCPSCKGPVKIKNKMIICRNCKLAYPKFDNIPIMLITKVKKYEENY